MTKQFEYPDYVISQVKTFFRENYGEYISREKVMRMSPSAVLGYYLEWEGIYGYDHVIHEIISAKEKAGE